MNRVVQLAGILLLGAAFVSACSGSSAAPAAQATLPPVTDDVAVSAEGRLVPVESVALNFGIGGEVAEVLVKEGDSVKAGDRIARLNDELNKAQRMETLGRLAGGVAHDFNNLLTSIMGNISLSSLPDISDEKVKQRLFQALKACHKAKDLSTQLLTFSKGGALENRTVMSLEKVIRETANFTMSGSNIDFKFVVANNLWSVEIDEGQISQVISNMLINAAQAMTNEGKITIKIENAEAKKEKGRYS